jgi:predicted lactoylglutathione lyase
MDEVMKLNERFIDAHVQAGITELELEIRPLEDFLPCGAEQAPAKHKPQIFVNLPVKDLAKSKEFFQSIGYTFNPQFTDENAACMIISDDIFAMLLTEKYFATFTPKKVADGKQTAEVMNALSLPSRAAVDELVNKALAAGAKRYCEPKDHGFMYQWGFEDPDGHIWEYLWMDPSFAQ